MKEGVENLPLSKNKGRKYYSILNVLYSGLNQIVIIVLGFVSRAVFIQYLNDEFLGVNSLFTEVLSLLSLADLGMTTVMTYSFFKPLAEKDESTLCKLINFYKKVYISIAVAIGVIGIALIPVLPFLVNMDRNIDHLYIYYLMFIAKTVASYLYVYKSSILSADQKNYIVTQISIVTKILLTLLQIIALYLTHNYFIFLAVDLIVTIIGNRICSLVADRYYPFLNKKEYLSKEEKKSIFRNIKGGFIYKVSSVLLTSTDNILISILVGTVMVGLYSNYNMVLSKISGLIAVIFASLNGSVGNLVASSSEDKRYKVYSVVQVSGYIMSGIVIICCYILMEDFVKLWLGERYILDNSILLACLLNNYLIIVLQPMWVYRDATGMYRKTKYIMLIAAIENIFLSVILGRIWGVFGIIIASAISRLTTYIWYEPVVLFKEYFNRSPKEFFYKQGFNIILLLIAMFPMRTVFDKWSCETWQMWILKGISIGLLSLVYMILSYCWRKDFKDAIRYIREVVKK